LRKGKTAHEETALMQSRSRNSEAAQRFAERRRREDAAPRLREVVPRLASLRIEVEEHRGTTNAGDPKHVRLVVVDSAPALFELPCGTHGCRDGGHDLTSAMLRALGAGTTRLKLEDECAGSTGSASCGTVMHVTVDATYRPPPPK
jgi:hypothetical protein